MKRFYREKIFPHLVDWSLSNEQIRNIRRRVLKGVQPPVLEIGFGTGLNLEAYPEDLDKVVTLDPNPGMQSLAKKRLRNFYGEVEFHPYSAERLPFEDRSFQSVVATFTLCSIENLNTALSEVRRVLKPEGHLVFLEHGHSHEADVAKWQNRLTPVQKRIGDGCHLNRNISQLLEKNGFDLKEIEKYYLEKVPKIMGYVYEGKAQPRPPTGEKSFAREV